MRSALAEIEWVDGSGRWFSYSIALIGCSLGFGISGWALYSHPVGAHRPDPIVLGSALLVAGASGAQIVHGAMRFDERGISAQTAHTIGRDPALMMTAGPLFLNQRAREARSTRFWGGAMTTAQGIGTTVLGSRLWAKAAAGERTVGIVLTALGAVNSAVGAVHFFGRPRAERIRDRTTSQAHAGGHSQFKLSVVTTDEGRLLPGFFASGQF
ncbi:MAG: hypothetical protein VX589_06935 [Myxococcota bacterium]|nr:hypothetical protein [Myxococcota bacterium]